MLLLITKSFTTPVLSIRIISKNEKGILVKLAGKKFAYVNLPTVKRDAENVPKRTALGLFGIPTSAATW